MRNLYLQGRTNAAIQWCHGGVLALGVVETNFDHQHAGSIVKVTCVPRRQRHGGVVSAHRRLRAYTVTGEKIQAEKFNFPPDFRITTATFCGLYVHFAADVHGETDWENVKTRHSPSVDGQSVHTIHGSVPFVESNWFERISVHGR